MTLRTAQTVLLAALIFLCASAVQGKESVISGAPAYVIQGDTISIEATTIGEQLSTQKPLTLLFYQRESRRWIPVGSSHSEHQSSFAKVTGNKVLFTYTDSASLSPGATYFGTTRHCTAKGICPMDVEPDEGVRVVVAQKPD